MNSTVISGTPRTNSMKITENSRTAGMCERRPSASRMPSGSEATMPTAATTMVTSMPPHCVVDDLRQAERRQAEQQDERSDRHDDEEIDHAEIAARRVEPGHPADAERQQREEHVDPPALLDRIEAVGEEVEPLDHEGPAGADLGLLRAAAGSRRGRRRPTPRR